MPRIPAKYAFHKLHLIKTNMKIIMSIQTLIALISSPFLAPCWIGDLAGGNVFYMGRAGVTGANASKELDSISPQTHQYGGR